MQGSRAKIRSQKGSGKAHLGDAQSPMLRGGGCAVTKKAQDFLKDLNEEMQRLLSDLMDIKDHVKIDLLRISVIESMKAILEASQYIWDYLEVNKLGEQDYKGC